jgi:hypothetical protein
MKIAENGGDSIGKGLVAGLAGTAAFRRHPHRSRTPRAPVSASAFDER